jgi:uncharacterized protein with HEPN domain
MDVDINVVWQIATRDLSTLSEDITDILEELEALD